MQNYTGKRGLAIDYENELPGVISKDPKVIIDAIEKEPYDMDELQRFCKNMWYMMGTPVFILPILY